MSGKNTWMNSLESRKQLLISESELNRAQLAKDMDSLAADVRALTSRAKSFGSIASSAAVLIAGLTAFRRGNSEAGEAKTTWKKTLLKGAGLVSTLWLAFRPRSRD